MSEIPSALAKRLDRGRRHMLRDAPKRRLCVKFEKGETNWYLNGEGQLRSLALASGGEGGGKPHHRVRLTHNFIRPVVEGKVSAATGRIPGYEVLPATSDFNDVAAARLARKVAVYGYDKWRLRQLSIKVVKLAIAGGGAGFAYPYFDTTVGPFLESPDGTIVGQGEVKVLKLSGNEVYWEPGVDFEDSSWWAVERAVPVDEVKDLPGYIDGKMQADANTRELPSEKATEGMVVLTEYLQRPSPKFPKGQRLLIACGRIITQPEPYPLKDVNGNVLDEPCIHRLVYTHDADTDRDLGLVWQLIDAQRTAQDSLNKATEWKNRCLMPQMLAEEGSLVNPRTDEPGYINFYKRGTRNPPQWEPVQPIPDSLFKLHDVARQIINDLGSDQDINVAPNVASSTVEAVLQQSQSRWASFMGDVAEWHSRLMRHCLLLVANYYTEPRLLQIRGRSGYEPVAGFRGSDLMGQVDVVVLPGSLEYRTRDQLRQDIFEYADRMWISPEEAMAAIDSGTEENLILSHQLDVARANRVISKIRDGSVMEMAPHTMTDPATGLPMSGPDGLPMQIPGYMPSEWDNLKVWKTVFGDWLKTDEYEELEPGMQEVGKQIWEGLNQLEAQAQQRAVDAQNAAAAQQGMSNAAKPAPVSPMPSMPGGITAPGGSGSATGPN